MMKQFMNDVRKTFTSNWVLLIILFGLILFPHIVGWITGDSPNGVGGRPRGESIFWQGLMIEAFILAILAMSYNLIFGFTGVISFGHALFFGMGGYVIATMLEKTDLSSDTGLILGILGGLLVSGVLSLIIGLVSLRLRGVYFALFTLAVAEMFFIYFGRLASTGGEDGFTIGDMPDWLNSTRNRLTFYYVALLIAVLTFFFIRRLIYSPTGSVFLAIRENEDRAKTIGYNTLGYKLFAITLAGMLASSAGMLQTLFNKKVGPEMLSVGFTIEPLLHTIIGGIGTFTGPVIGAMGLHLADTQLRDAVITIGSTEINIGDSWQLLLGIIFIVVVIVFPLGIVGTLNRWWLNAKHARISNRTDSVQANVESTPK